MQIQVTLVTEHVDIGISSPIHFNFNVVQYSVLEEARTWAYRARWWFCTDCSQMDGIRPDTRRHATGEANEGCNTPGELHSGH